ncbi:MAG: polysaccharide deacetylase family protein [Rhodothalassiaceae bacterium]
MSMQAALNVRALAAALAALVCAGCAGAPAPYMEVARDESLAVIVANRAMSLETLARAYYGDADRASDLARFNRMDRVEPGQDVVVPLRAAATGGISADGYQTVTILCYHRFTDAATSDNRMIVTAAAFRRQLRYLRDHGYKVVPLSQVVDFLDRKADLPDKAVVLTIDDGFRSVYSVAYPILRDFNMPATLFVYHDFMGGDLALTRSQLQDLAASPLFDLQSHSKTHDNLALQRQGESVQAYRRRLIAEVEVPEAALKRLNAGPQYAFSYPYGNGSLDLIDILQERGYRIATTVQRGGNASFSHPYMLRRTMIFGDDDLDTFIRRLESFERVWRG